MTRKAAGFIRTGPSSYFERATAADKLLEELAKVNQQGTPLVVEGPNDEAALREMGLVGSIIKLNTGQSVLATVEGLAQQQNAKVHNYEACLIDLQGSPGFIILMDWDRKGDQLAKRLKEAARACDLVADDSYRLKLKALAGSTISCVEDLPSFLAHAQLPGT